MYNFHRIPYLNSKITPTLIHIDLAQSLQLFPYNLNILTPYFKNRHPSTFRPTNRHTQTKLKHFRRFRAPFRHHYKTHYLEQGLIIRAPQQLVSSRKKHTHALTKQNKNRCVYQRPFGGIMDVKGLRGAAVIKEEKPPAGLI